MKKKKYDNGERKTFPVTADKNGMWQNTADEYDSDVLGSYTGVPIDDDYPVQDADDL